MLIQHASIPADDPKSAAEVIGRLVDGEVTKFPPGGPDAWMAWSPDGSLQLEVTKRGRRLVPDEKSYGWSTTEPLVRHSETHIGFCVDKSEDELIAIAEQAGWPAMRSDRGGMFNVVEIWVEGNFLLEFMDPEQTARMRKMVTLENWKRFAA